MDNIYNYYKFNEMLKHTLSLGQTQQKITTDVFQLNNNKISKNDYFLTIEGKNIIVELKNHYDINEVKYILSSIYSTGFFISKYYISSKKMNDYLIKDENEFLLYWSTSKKKNIKYDKNIIKIKLFCEPKWDNSVQAPELIYHITEQENTKFILKHGLIPRSEKKKSYHPHRIYFISDKKQIKAMFMSLKQNNFFNKYKNNIKYDVLKIDTRNLKSKGFNEKDYNNVFYDDKNSQGIYTYDRIQKENITMYKEILNF